MLIGNLLGDGIILGLLGAESALADPSFIVSAEYQHALRIGFRGAFGFGFGKRENSPVHRKVFGLALFILWASALSALAGPASAVLMIPRVDWNYFDKRAYTPPISDNMFPNVMISTSDSDSDLWDGYPQYFLGLEYWDYYFANSGWNETNLDDLNHDFGDVGSTVYINTTGTYNRELHDEWDGGTVITCMMQDGFQQIQDNTWAVMRMDQIGKGWRGLKSTVNINALNASVTSRNRDKIPCNATAVLSDLDWCYMGVDRSYSGPDTLRRGQDLLLAADYEYILDNSRVWITEGPRSVENQHYSESIEVVFEGRPSLETPEAVFDLTVCSFSGALVAGIGTAPGARDTPQKVELFDYALRSNGSRAKPRKLLFHKNWLDHAHAIEIPLPDELPESTTNTSVTDPFSFPQRPRTYAPRYNLLGMFGNNTRKAGSRSNALGNQTQALPIEVVVGGALTYLLVWTPTAVSQYSMQYNDIPQEFTEGIGDEESWLTEYVVKVYSALH